MTTNTSKSPLRCDWCGTDPLYQQYHDEEWGVPVTHDAGQFEFIILESAQAGLSWITILRKRENYRAAFAQFDPEQVARFTQRDIERLMTNSGIVRNRLKIESAISNAQHFLDIQQEFGSFSRYLWNFVDGKPIQNTYQQVSDIPTSTDLSDRISKALKKRGFRFFGTTICYSHLQATGLINDHLVNCHRHQLCKRLGKSLTFN